MTDKNFPQRIENLKQKFDLEKIRQEISQIEAESSQADFWQNSETASEKMKKLAALQKDLEEIKELEALWQNEDLAILEKKISQLEIKTFLSREYDRSDAIFSIHAGQGGVEAMDWVKILERMYQKYFERKNWQVEVTDLTPGEEAGIKSVTMTVSGNYAYGYLKYEAGTHRLVRQSPFNADHLRQTSFALVEAIPLLKEVEVDVKDEDLEWQFFRSSTQGGQNVQKVSTAVRLIHKPTNTIVTCQTQRYQEQNRKIALEILRSKLWVLAQSKKEDEVKKIKGGRTKATWGTQIRSYVLHPYKMVKDLRTGCETGDAESVLNGELDSFIEAEIKAMV